MERTSMTYHPLRHGKLPPALYPWQVFRKRKSMIR